MLKAKDAGTAQGWGVSCERGRLQSARARQNTHTHNDTLHTHTHTQPYTPPPLAPHAPPAGEEQTPGEGSAAPYKTEGLAPTLAAPAPSTLGTRRAVGTGRRGPARGKCRAQPGG